MLASDGRTLKDWQIRKALEELDDVAHARGMVVRLLTMEAPLLPSEREFLAQWCGLEDGNADAQD